MADPKEADTLVDEKPTAPVAPPTTLPVTLPVSVAGNRYFGAGQNP